MDVYLLVELDPTDDRKIICIHQLAMGEGAREWLDEQMANFPADVQKHLRIADRRVWQVK